MMDYKIYLTNDAVVDLEEIHEFISVKDDKNKADGVINNIAKLLDKLKSNPNRGRYVKELLALGNKEYREISFKPYRIIYRVLGDRVYVYLIVDGRRSLELLLEKKLLGS